VAVSSQTHFLPEALHSASAQLATNLSKQDQAEAGAQASFSLSQKQFASDLSTASPRNDLLRTPALAPEHPDVPQPQGFAQLQTKATAQAAQQLGSTADRPNTLESQAEDPANAVSASGLSVTPSKRGGLPFKDTASHNYPSGGPASTPADAPQSFEVPPAIAPGAAGASLANPAQQVFDGIQRALPGTDNSQTSPNALQPSLDVQQQALKTITVALSPASLGNVAVELSLKSGQLGVKLQVQEPGTVQLLRQDGSLQKLLESAGYTVQSLSIHLSPQPNQPPQGQTAPNGQSFSNSFSSSGGGQEQGHSQSYKGRTADRNGDQRPGYGRTEDVSGGGSLYV
jgi:hypothetical protein